MDTGTRAKPRAAVALVIDCEFGVERRQGRGIDLSVTGLRLQLEGPPPVGTLLKIGFELPGRPARVEAIGRAVWAEAGAEPPHMGLRFERFLQGYVELGDFLVEQLGGTPQAPG
jgi:hypothetical protein